MTAGADGARAILYFWFREIGPKRWWTRSTEIDAAIVARFRNLWQEWRARPVQEFLGTAGKALAAVVLFDQFARNMFRGTSQAFITDPLALGIAEAAIDGGLDRLLDSDQRAFLYMPFMHSEEFATQERALALFDALGQRDQIRYARLHHDLIARYGRFPARNAALGRRDRPGEEEAIERSKDW